MKVHLLDRVVWASIKRYCELYSIQNSDRDVRYFELDVCELKRIKRLLFRTSVGVDHHYYLGLLLELFVS